MRSLVSRTTLIILVIAAAGCGGRSPDLNIQSPAPNPNGCYVMVFDQPFFGGVSDVFNRPGRWASLERLTDTREHSWRDRIRSVRTGSAATAKLFTNDNFAGESLQLSASTDRGQFEGQFATRVRSVEITCDNVK
jgi:hypothetical protein